MATGTACNEHTSLMKFSVERKAEAYSWHRIIFHGKNNLLRQVYLYVMHKK